MTIAKTHNINVRDNHGLTPLMLAAMLGDEPTVLALLKAGADVDLESNDSTNALGYARDAKGMDGTCNPAIVFALKVESMKKYI